MNVRESYANSLLPDEKLLLNRREAAELLGISPHTLAVWACEKRYGLPVVKVGGSVKYLMSDVMNFINRRTVKN